MKSFAPAWIAVALALTGCVANSPSGGDAPSGPIDVTISDDACDLKVNQLPAGSHTFTLNNKGTVRNEFEILAEDKLQIVGERENLGPGTTTDYTIVLKPGRYYTACKKNMVGALVDVRELTVTEGDDTPVSEDDKQLADQAVTNYTAYVRDQAGQLLAATKQFADDYKAGNVDAAKKQYPEARMFYERIEPTAEAFGDIDPALDEREVDYQESDETDQRKWTGWHVAERDLWRPDGFEGLTDQERGAIADGLVADTQKLYDLVYASDFKLKLDDISNGAIGLLEEVATSKITGEEEAFSHTDLWDFQANVEGAKVAFGNVEELAQKKDAELTATIKARFDELSQELDKYKQGDGYVSYDRVKPEQRKDLSDKVDALRVPLAKLTETILK